MARGFDVTIRITGQEDVSLSSARAEQALGRLGERGSRALQRIGVVASSVKQSLEALGQVASLGAVASAAQQIARALAIEQVALASLGPALADHADQSRATAVAQRELAVGVTQVARSLMLTTRSARQAARSLAAVIAISMEGRRLQVLPPLFDGFGLGLAPSILPAQHGLIADRPTLTLAGEAGRELIVPERRSRRSAEVQREFERLASDEGGGEVTIVVPVTLDGRRIAKVVARHHRRGVQ